MGLRHRKIAYRTSGAAAGIVALVILALVSSLAIARPRTAPQHPPQPTPAPLGAVPLADSWTAADPAPWVRVLDYERQWH